METTKKMNECDFEDIRPYTDAEVAEAAPRMAANPALRQVFAFLFPKAGDEAFEAFRLKLSQVKTSWEFQVDYMQAAVRSIVGQTSAGVDCAGFADLDSGEPHLFVSNHRDIVLDAAILQVLLYDNGLPTSEISFGDNLMSGPFVVDVGKSNKMFKVIRSATAKEFLHNSRILSGYMRDGIVNRGASSWIAQRNGRTKNGVDKTDQGIVKMFGMSAREGVGFAEGFAELHITPVSVSYEYEPCDREKVWENYVSMSRKYVKAPGEDFSSIIKGIRRYKGHIYYRVAQPIRLPELLEIENKYAGNERYRALADYMDGIIRKGYTCWNTNYIAYDLLTDTLTYREKYEWHEVDAFRAYMDARLDGLEGDVAVLRRLFLELYAGPLM